jgi:hypothetical protein
VVPYAWISANGDVRSTQDCRPLGFGDLAMRLAVNSSAPALSLQEFRDYRQDTIVGVSSW